jgi:hypothetical protein
MTKESELKKNAFKVKVCENCLMPFKLCECPEDHTNKETMAITIPAIKKWLEKEHEVFVSNGLIDKNWRNPANRLRDKIEELSLLEKEESK